MRKKNKLYTANKWNQSLFVPTMSEEQPNLFWDGGMSNPAFQSIGTTSVLPNPAKTDINQIKAMKTPGLPKPKLNIGAKGMLTSAAGAIGGAVGALGNKLISGGYSSGAGNAISSIGGTVGSAISSVNPLVGGIVSAASGVVGGVTNALFGTKVNQAKLNAAKEGTNYFAGFKSDASSFDDIQGPNAMAAVQNAYSGGVFKKGWARRRNRELKAQRAIMESYANRSVDNNIDNIASTQMDNLESNYAAFGGLLDSPGGAIDYGFMSDYLTTKNRAVEAKNKIPTNVFGNLPVTPLSTFALGGGIHIKKSHRGLFTKEAKEHGMGVQEFASHVLANKDEYSPEVIKRANFARNASKFALGGDMQTNGSDFSNGLMHIDAGLSHEENPYDGVQLGTDAQGKPNLVEEGETVFDDYVFSKRIKVDEQTKKKFHIGKNADLSYADLSKKLETESAERPNDPLSQAALKKMMHSLAEEQERQKGEMQAKEAQDAFNQLPPEQQRAIMQQVAMEEQQAQQQQMGQPTENTPQDFQQAVDEQMMQQQPEQPMMESDNTEQMNACGGKINRYDDGGKLIKQKVLNSLGIYTEPDWEKWRTDHKLAKITDWENISKNRPFIEAITAAHPEFADVISKGYNFGTYTPTNKGLTFDFTHGGWGKEDYDAWNGSTDAAWKEAVKKGLVKKGMNSEEIGKALSQTDAYKRGSDWLKADENNRLTYLQQILNSQDAPQAARDYAAKYVDANGWLKDAKRDYQTIFEDPNGTGVRNTHPGTYWKTPEEILRNNQIINRVVNDDGTVTDIIGDVPKDWTKGKSFSWQDDNSDYTYNYYRRPNDGTSDNSDNGNSEDEKLVPKHKNEAIRYAGIFGPAVGLGLQALGVGKPDYSRMDAAVEAASGSPAFVQYKPIGNYLTYNPMDIWYEQNRMNANSRATDRAILNNSSPIGTKTAGLLANGYNSQIASGNLFRQAQEYNDAQRQKIAEFNRGTDMYNANAFNQNSITNAEIANRNRQFKAQMQMDAARQRMAADAAWNQGIYGNVSGLFKGLSDIGRENAQHNMIADMAADGIFGVITPNSNTGKRVVRKASKGGKINRKRGLTF